MVGNPNSGPKTPQEYFNTAAFQIPILANQPGSTYSFGNEGRDVIEGPGIVTLDLSLVRNFTIKERFKIQFRAESFDSLNHPIFNEPNITADNPAFGTITSTIVTGTPNRQNQLALRLLF